MLLAPASPWCGQGDREVGGNYYREVCGCVSVVCVGSGDHHIIIIIIIIIIPDDQRGEDGVLSRFVRLWKRTAIGACSLSIITRVPTALNTGSKVRQLRTGTLGTHGVQGGFEPKIEIDTIEFRYDGDAEDHPYPAG